MIHEIRLGMGTLVSQVEDRAVRYAVADICTPEHLYLSDVHFLLRRACALYGCSAYARTVQELAGGWSLLCREHAMDLYCDRPLWPEPPV
jgi:hypothetical protein